MVRYGTVHSSDDARLAFDAIDRDLHFPRLGWIYSHHITSHHVTLHYSVTWFTYIFYDPSVVQGQQAPRVTRKKRGFVFPCLAYSRSCCCCCCSAATLASQSAHGQTLLAQTDSVDACQLVGNEKYFIYVHWNCFRPQPLSRRGLRALNVAAVPPPPPAACPTSPRPTVPQDKFVPAGSKRLQAYVRLGLARKSEVDRMLDRHLPTTRVVPSVSYQTPPGAAAPAPAAAPAAQSGSLAAAAATVGV